MRKEIPKERARGPPTAQAAPLAQHMSDIRELSPLCAAVQREWASAEEEGGRRKREGRQGTAEERIEQQQQQQRVR